MNAAHSDVSVAASPASGRVAAVLLHGSADTPQAWRGVEALVAAHMDVYCPALPTVTRHDVSAMEGDLAWLDAQMRERTARVLGGHSYGGLLALRWALRNPTALDALLLVEPIAWGLLRGHAASVADQQMLRDCATLFRDGDAARALAWLVDYWNGAGAWSRLAGAVQQQLLDGVVRTAAEVRAGAEDATTVAELAQLHCRVAILCGSDTTTASRHVQETLATAAPAADWTLVHGARHALLRSHPEATAAALLRMAQPAEPGHHRTATTARGT